MISPFKELQHDEVNDDNAACGFLAGYVFLLSIWYRVGPSDDKTDLQWRTSGPTQVDDSFRY